MMAALKRVFRRLLVSDRTAAIREQALEAGLEGAKMTGTINAVMDEAKRNDLHPLAMLAHEVNKASMHRQIDSGEEKG